MPTILQIVLLAIVQGATELLPVSSSAHVIALEKLMGLDPSSPPMTLMLVLLHTGTMFSVVVYFWKRWSETYFRTQAEFERVSLRVGLSTLVTVAVGLPLKVLIENRIQHGRTPGEVETLFSRLDLVAAALLAAGILIFVAGLFEPLRRPKRELTVYRSIADQLSLKQAVVIGVAQGISLPFRGFSRSGVTISSGMLTGVARKQAESFSFALALVLTPAVICYEAMRLMKNVHQAEVAGMLQSGLGLGLLGMLFSFLAGLVALRWLSAWLESGKWLLFGTYCIFAAGALFFLDGQGF